MFEFLFGKKQEINVEEVVEKNLPLASITYSIANDDNKTPMIDIELSDYDTKGIDALCMLLDILSQDSSYLETIEMIKNGLIADHQEEALIKIFTHISEQAGKKIARSHKESIKDQPCIKPSDMLK